MSSLTRHRKADLEATVQGQAETIRLLRSTVKVHQRHITALETANAALVEMTTQARETIAQVVPVNGFTEHIITRGRIYAMLRGSYSFSTLFLDVMQEAMNADDPASLLPPQTPPAEYSWGELVYASTYLSLWMAAFIRMTHDDIDVAREAMMEALDIADNYILKTEDLRDAQLAPGDTIEFFAEDDDVDFLYDDEDGGPDAEEPGANA